MGAFEEYLTQKKIDPIAFQKGDPARWQEFKNLFDQVHPGSFTAQKLFLINAIRRSYPLVTDTSDEVKIKGKAKPKIKIPPRRPKTD